MAVSQELLDKIKGYEGQYSADQILSGIAESPKYNDVAEKIANYRSQGLAPETILAGIKAAPVVPTSPGIWDRVASWGKNIAGQVMPAPLESKPGGYVAAPGTPAPEVGTLIDDNNTTPITEETAKKNAEFLKTLPVGIAEAGANMATGVGSFAISGINQFAVTLKSMIEGSKDPVGDGKRAGEWLANKLTYQPKTEAGQELSNIGGVVMNAPFEALDHTMQLVGIPDSVREGVNEGVKVGLAATGVAHGAAARIAEKRFGIPQGAQYVPRPTEEATAAAQKVPYTAERPATATQTPEPARPAEIQPPVTAAPEVPTIDRSQGLDAWKQNERRYNESAIDKIRQLTVSAASGDAAARREILDLFHDRHGSPILSGAGNELMPSFKYKVFMDVDNFKNFNNIVDYAGADQILAHIGNKIDAISKKYVLDDSNSKHARIMGDEFASEASKADALRGVYDELQRSLPRDTINVSVKAGSTIKLPDGEYWTVDEDTVIPIKGVGISYGLGETTDAAKAAAKADKQRRAEAGLRTERGSDVERPVRHDADTAQPVSTLDNPSPAGNERLTVGPTERDYLGAAAQAVRDIQHDNYIKENEYGEAVRTNRSWSNRKDMAPWLPDTRYTHAQAADILERAYNGDLPKPNETAKWRLIEEAINHYEREADNAAYEAGRTAESGFPWEREAANEAKDRQAQEGMNLYSFPAGPIVAAGKSAAKFVKEDVTPALTKAGESIAEISDSARRVLAPAGRNEEASMTAHELRQLGAERARTLDVIDKQTLPARKLFDKSGGKITDPGSLSFQFIQHIEKGTIDQLPEALRPFAKLSADIMDNLLDEVKRRGKLTGKMTTAEKLRGGANNAEFLTYYFPRMWKDPAKAESIMARLLSKRPFEGGKAFLKQRTLELFEDGISAGLKPAFDNPIDFIQHKSAEMTKWIMAHDWMKGEKDAGRLKFVSLGDTAPEGWIKIDDRMGTVYAPRSEGGAGPQLVGHYYAPEGSATVFNNLVSKGMSGSALYRGYRGVANVMNQWQLGFSLFHAGFTSVDAMVSSFANGIYEAAHGNMKRAAKDIAETPIAAITNAMRGDKVYKEWMNPGSYPEFADTIKAIQAGGGRARMDKFYETDITRKMMKALREGNVIGGLVRSPFALTEQSVKPVLEWLVPRQKLGILAQMVKGEMERNPNMTRAQLQKVMARAVDSVDNRMGQLIYDNLFWNKTAKDLAMASVRSVGWNLGDIREFGGAAIDTAKAANKLRKGQRPEFTYRMSYAIALPILVGGIGAMITKLSTGDDPKDMRDYFFPRVGGTDTKGQPNRVALPSYMKDIYHVGKDPVQMAKNKIHPMLSTIAQMLDNRDFYGVKIRNEDDPLIKRALDTIKYPAQQLEPFASRGYRQSREQGEPAWKSAASFIGITPAPASVNKTEAREVIDKINREKAERGTRTSEQYQKSRMIAHLETAIRNNDPTAQAQILQAYKEKKISFADRMRIAKEAHQDPLVKATRSFSLKEMEKVIDVATPEEKAKLLPLMKQKKVRAILRGNYEVNQ